MPIRDRQFGQTVITTVIPYAIIRRLPDLKGHFCIHTRRRRIAPRLLRMRESRWIIERPLRQDESRRALCLLGAPRLLARLQSNQGSPMLGPHLLQFLLLSKEDIASTRHRFFLRSKVLFPSQERLRARFVHPRVVLHVVGVGIQVSTLGDLHALRVAVVLLHRPPLVL